MRLVYPNRFSLFVSGLVREESPFWNIEYMMEYWKVLQVAVSYSRFKPQYYSHLF